MSDRTDRDAADRVAAALAAWGNPLIDERIRTWQDDFDPYVYGRRTYDGAVRRVAEATVVYDPGGNEADYGFGGERFNIYYPPKLEVTAECATADGRSQIVTVEVEMGERFDFGAFLTTIVASALRA